MCESTEFAPYPHLPAINSTTHSCTHFSCHGDNLFVRSRLLEICPSDSVNVRVAGRAVMPQGVQGSVSLCVCVYMHVRTSSAIGGGISVPVSVYIPFFGPLFCDRRGMLEYKGTDIIKDETVIM